MVEIGSKKRMVILTVNRTLHNFAKKQNFWRWKSYWNLRSWNMDLLNSRPSLSFLLVYKTHKTIITKVKTKLGHYLGWRPNFGWLDTQMYQIACTGFTINYSWLIKLMQNSWEFALLFRNSNLLSGLCCVSYNLFANLGRKYYLRIHPDTSIY